MRLTREKFLLATCLLLLSSFGWADVITFSSLPGNGTAIPNGYAGFDWNNFSDMRMALAPHGGGAVPLVGSFAYNGAGGAASFGSSNTFTLTSAWLSPDGMSYLRLEVVGLLNGKVVDSTKVTLGPGAPKLVTFDWSGIDGVRFVPQASATASEKPLFAISELVVSPSPVPEPASMLLLVSGAGLALGSVRRLRPGK